jgi:hypothetical protein
LIILKLLKLKPILQLTIMVVHVMIEVVPDRMLAVTVYVLVGLKMLVAAVVNL